MSGTGTLTACNREAEEAILASVLAGVSFDFSELSPEEFFFPLHRRLYTRMRVMNAMEEPTNVLAVIEPMGLDEQEQQAVAALQNPLYGPFTTENLRGYVRLVKRQARHRDLQRACQGLLNANGDIPLRAGEVRAQAERYLETSAPAESGLTLFDTAKELEQAPALLFAIEGFLQCEAATLIAGLSGDFKTWLVLSVVKALLDESKILWDTFPVTQKAARVVYLIPESGRGPFRHRLEVLGLMPYVHSARLLVRTLSKGPAPQLQDPRLLAAIKGADICSIPPSASCRETKTPPGTTLADSHLTSLLSWALVLACSSP
jgi:hypothetical protein